MAAGAQVMSSKVKHPILRLEVLGPDGTVTTDHVVFCQSQHRSVRVEECTRCVHCDSISEDPSPTVECTIPMTPLPRAEDPRGERIEVGNVLCRGTVVVSDTVRLAEAIAVLRYGDRRSVAIVDDRHVMVGLVHDGDPSRRLGRMAELVGAVMTTSIAIDEATPVRVALKVLAANHLREATVISQNGVPIGVFRDVDGLDWISSSR